MSNNTQEGEVRNDSLMNTRNNTETAKYKKRLKALG